MMVRCTTYNAVRCVECAAGKLHEYIPTMCDDFTCEYDDYKQCHCEPLVKPLPQELFEI